MLYRSGSYQQSPLISWLGSDISIFPANSLAICHCLSWACSAMSQSVLAQLLKAERGDSVFAADHRLS